MDQPPLCRAQNYYTKCCVDEGKQGPGEGICISALGGKGVDEEKRK